jgi:hypothetical protein
MELWALFLIAQIDSNGLSYEKQIPFDTEAQVYEIDSSFAQKLEFFKDYKGFQKALLFVQPDSSYIIEIYQKKVEGIVKERVKIEPETINRIQQEIALIKSRAISEQKYDRSGYAQFLGNSFLFAFGIQAPLVVMGFSPDDFRIGVALYMLSSASGFVIPLMLTKNCDVSKAHSDMFAAGGMHGLYIGGALSGIGDMALYEGGGAFLTLGGSIIGEYLGFQSVNEYGLTLGRGNTIFVISDFIGASSVGALSLFDNWFNPRMNIKHYLGISLAGLGLGIYTGSKVTQNINLGDGDPTIFADFGIAGGAVLPVALSWFDNGRGRISGKMYVSAGITGLVLGSILGYRVIKEKDYSESEGNIITLGGFAGALTGLGLVYIARIEELRAYYTGMVIGDIVGALTTASYIKAGKSNMRTGIHFYLESLIGLGLCYYKDRPFQAQLFRVDF